MRLRIASKRTLSGSVLLAAELSKPAADNDHVEVVVVPFPPDERLVGSTRQGVRGRSHLQGKRRTGWGTVVA
jgi:hypothetical protein